MQTFPFHYSILFRLCRSRPERENIGTTEQQQPSPSKLKYISLIVFTFESFTSKCTTDNVFINASCHELPKTMQE